MYLRAFPPDERDAIGNRIFNEGADPDACRASGGVPAFSDYPGTYSGTIRRIWRCSPGSGAGSSGAGSSPAVSVSVPTNVTTQVSPNITPAFVQQSSPSNSPVTTSLPARTGGIDTVTSAEGITARDAAILDALSRVQAASPAQAPQVVYGAPVEDSTPPPAPVQEASLARYVPYLAIAGFGIAVLNTMRGKRSASVIRRRRRR